MSSSTQQFVRQYALLLEQWRREREGGGQRDIVSAPLPATEAVTETCACHCWANHPGSSGVCEAASDPGCGINEQPACWACHDAATAITSSTSHSITIVEYEGHLRQYDNGTHSGDSREG